MLVLSSACTFQSVVAALVGGGLIGALAGTRLLGQHKTLPSATFVPSVTFGVIGGGYLLQQLLLCTGNTVAADHPGIPLFFEPPGSSLSYGRILLAAACVGAGAKLGQGCTCGNGIQGLSGFSRTSFQFVCIFMITAMVVASLFQTAHTLDVVDAINDNDNSHQIDFQYTTPSAYLLIQIGIAAVGIIAQLNRTSVVPTVVIDVLAGIAFATALSVSGMIKPSKVVDFLDVFGTRGWDPSLLGVMGGGIAVCMSLYQFADGIKTPAAVSASASPLAMLHPWITRPMDLEHLLGALLFGTGWGLAGLCPGPVLVNCGLQSYKAIVFALVMFGIRPIIGALQAAMGRTKTRTSTTTRPAGPTTTTTSYKKD